MLGASEYRSNDGVIGEIGGGWIGGVGEGSVSVAPTLGQWSGRYARAVVGDVIAAEVIAEFEVVPTLDHADVVNELIVGDIASLRPNVVKPPSRLYEPSIQATVHGTRAVDVRQVLVSENG